MYRKLMQLNGEVKEVLKENILPYWMGKMSDNEHGGYFGQITGNEVLVKDAPRGAILNARILWTFSAAGRLFCRGECINHADRAYDYILKHFFDKECGGTYWMLDCDGKVINDKKQIYSQAFFIYALVEYYRLSNCKEALDKAVELYELIEKYSFDKENNGYFESFDRNWQLLDDVRLSEKDANEVKTMNTHLHILEAYTNLYRVYKDVTLEERLVNLINIFTEKIINRNTFHLDLFFDEFWTCKSSIISFGHDIEASWLIQEAAEVVGNEDLLKKIKDISIKIADAAAEGIQENGSLINEKNTLTGHEDRNSDWWPQAEMIVGYFNTWQNTKDSKYFYYLFNNWTFVRNHIIDFKNGEWYWSVDENGNINTNGDKAGFWKCPYHNSRMCLEIIERISKI